MAACCPARRNKRVEVAGVFDGLAGIVLIFGVGPVMLDKLETKIKEWLRRNN